MMKALTLNTAAVTMSSLEIAGLTDKEHRNVVADIKRILDDAEIEGAGFLAPYKMPSGQATNIYNLPRRECDLVISGYSVKYRLAIIDRWHELELATPKAPTNYIEALQALIQSEITKELAIATKAEIGSRREATAMNTASQAVKKANKLEIQLDRSMDYCTIKRAEMLFHGLKFNWRILKSACNEMGALPIDVFDANYGTVKAYPVAVWLEAYALDVVGGVQ